MRNLQNGRVGWHGEYYKRRRGTIEIKNTSFRTRESIIFLYIKTLKQKNNKKRKKEKIKNQQKFYLRKKKITFLL